MTWLDIEQRNKKILEFIINTYITTAEPVSSRAICNRHKLGICSATIRNIMADLEDQGLITHPHTSAGRVPTDRGYRFYIDFLLQELLPTADEREYIAREYHKLNKDIEYLLVKTCEMLADVTKYAGVVSFPQIEKSKLKRIDLIGLEDKKVVVVLVTDTGVVKNTIVELKTEFDEDELKRLVRFLNAQLQDVELEKVRQILMQKFLGEKGEVSILLQKGLDLIETSLASSVGSRLYLEGAKYLLEQPEFRDWEKTKKVIKMMDDKRQLLEIMQRDIDNNRVKIYIGKENKYEEIKDCTMVVAHYRVGSISGAVGVIGPKRMNYAKVIPVVECISQVFCDVLEEMSI